MDIHSKHVYMHKNGIFYALIYINNHSYAYKHVLSVYLLFYEN